MNAQWSVLAVYENAEARQQVIRFCDSLVQRFWSEFSIELNWCDWPGLEDSATAKEASGKLREAELIIVATSSKGIIPFYIKSWLELSLHDRREREGVLAGLPGPEAGLSAEAASTQAYLRKLAHRAGLDYLTAVPQSLPARVPESTEAYNQRATQVTSVLEKILHYSPIPPSLL